MLASCSFEVPNSSTTATFLSNSNCKFQVRLCFCTTVEFYRTKLNTARTAGPFLFVFLFAWVYFLNLHSPSASLCSTCSLICTSINFLSCQDTHTHTHTQTLECVCVGQITINRQLAVRLSL